MPDIVLKDKAGSTEIYDEVEVVSLTDSDGNEQLYYSEDKFGNYYTKEETYSKEESYSKTEVDDLIEDAVGNISGSPGSSSSGDITGTIEDDGSVTILFGETFFSIE